MDWSFHKTKLKWYEYAWAVLPIGVVAVGGAIGGLCGGAAAAINISLMHRPWPALPKYAATGVVSLASVAIYFVVAKIAVTMIYGGPADQVAHELRKSPLFVTIERVSPQDAAAIRDGVTQAVEQHKSQGEVAYLVESHVGALLRKYVPVASDQAITDFASVTTLEIDQIGAKDAKACYRFLYPQPGLPPINLTTYVSTEVSQREIEVSDTIVETAIADPQHVPARAEVTEALNQIGRQLTTDFGASNVGALLNPATIEPATVCAMISSLYKDALSLPAAERVPTLRFLFAQNAGA
jgi:hypothetical protein